MSWQYRKTAIFVLLLLSLLLLLLLFIYSLFLLILFFHTRIITYYYYHRRPFFFRSFSVSLCALLVSFAHGTDDVFAPSLFSRPTRPTSVETQYDYCAIASETPSDIDVGLWLCETTRMYPCALAKTPTEKPSRMRNSEIAFCQRFVYGNQCRRDFENRKFGRLFGKTAILCGFFLHSPPPPPHPDIVRFIFRF